MGFETQEEAERWAENMEFRADQARDERMILDQEAEMAWGRFLADNPTFTAKTPGLIDLARAAYKRGYKDGRIP